MNYWDAGENLIRRRKKFHINLEKTWSNSSHLVIVAIFCVFHSTWSSMNYWDAGENLILESSYWTGEKTCCIETLVRYAVNGQIVAIWGEWLCRLRHFDRNWNVPSSNLKRGSFSLGGCQWHLDQNLTNAVIDTVWMRLSPQYWPKIVRGAAK